MGGTTLKIPTACPNCGHSQLEPPAAQSTYCRGCGDHYRIERNSLLAHSAEVASTPVMALANRVSHALFNPKFVKLDCRSCSRIFSVRATETARANCPTCGTVINLADIHITANSSRCIDTRGTVHVAKDAFLNSVDIRCGSLICDGRISGRIRCVGTARLGGNGVCHAQVFADTVIIDKGANLRLPYPISAREIIVIGKLEADLAPSQRVTVRRRGSVIGTVETRSMIVDRGGSFSGDVRVRSNQITRQKTEPENTATSNKDPLWQPHLAFS